MTIGGQSCAEVGGFVQLLDQKVLDPRLLSKLLRFQAAMLLRLAFTRNLTAFRFECHPRPSALSNSLPLGISLLALLVEGSFYGELEATRSEGERTTCFEAAEQRLERVGGRCPVRAAVEAVIGEVEIRGKDRRHIERCARNSVASCGDEPGLRGPGGVRGGHQQSLGRFVSGTPVSRSPARAIEISRWSGQALGSTLHHST